MNYYLQNVPNDFQQPNASGLPFEHRVQTSPIANEHKLLKNLIWIYFILLVFEGALRKWFLPGLATPLLVVRDPIALMILLISWQRGLLPATPYLFGMLIIGFISFITAILFGHGNLWVALFGVRILLLHYPLIFAIGRVFTRDDVVRMGQATLLLTIPLAMLLVVQFYSPQSAWVNRGLGGAIEGAGFSGALGFFRPSTTFSFTNGTSMFFGFAAIFIIYFWANSFNISRLILIGATVSLLISIPLSISRSLFFGVGVSVLFMIVAISRNPRFLWRVIPAALGTVILVTLLLQADFFKQGLEVFSTRFESASESEGGLEGILLDRYFGGLLGALLQLSQFPFFGYGIGLGTNVGSMLVKGEVLYLISEGEWGRLIGELGPLLGLFVILLRVGLCLKFSAASYLKVIQGDFLPWMLLSYGLFIIPQGQWGQPTTLGFTAMIGGLMLASLRVKTKEVYANKVQYPLKNDS